MLGKKLLSRFVKIFLFVFIFLISFLLFNSKSFVVLGQEDTSPAVETIIEVENFKTEDFTSDQALLFVQESSEASQGILEYIESFKTLDTDIFHLYVVNVPKEGSVFTEYQNLYKNICDIDNVVVPVLIYKDVCVYGYDEIAVELAVRFKLENENLELKEAISENLEILDGAVEEYNKEVESKTFVDWLKSLDTKTYIIIGICFVVTVGVIVLIIVFKDKLRGNKKWISSIAPVFIVVVSTGYLLYEVNNTQKDFAPLDSSAGCIADGNCATWADRVADGLNSDDVSTRLHYEQVKEQMKKDEEAFGSNAAHLVATPQESDLYPEILAMSEGEKIIINTTTYVRCGSGLCDSNGGSKNISKLFTENSDAVVNQDIVIKDINGSDTEKSISSTTINQFLSSSGFDDNNNNGISDVEEAAIKAEKDSYIKTDNGSYCIKNGNLVDCNPCRCPSSEGGGTSVSCCNDYSYVKEGNVNEEGTIRFEYDAKSGKTVIVPNGKAFIDPCEGGEGNNITARILCNCGNGIFTSAYSASSCDAVCRVENLICDDCNPEEPDQPDPPDNPEDPYCGDGILGNTSGEECEYGDPNGVTCSWNTCSSTCTCPEITEPYCGDGTLDEGEMCELGDPTDATCTWDNCNHVLCKCVEPGCGDGTLDQGETCERNDPDGVSCLWDTECNQLECSCKVEKSPYCGDGILNDGEYCEEGNPSGSTCDWTVCSKSTCTCPTSSPQTSIFDDTEQKLFIGFGLLILGFFVTPLTKLLSNYYIKIGNGVLKIGKNVTKKRREKFENKVLKKD